MATIKLKGATIHTSGMLPSVGEQVPDFSLSKLDLSSASLKDFPGKKILNVFPSVDTSVCARSVQRFAEEAARRKGVAVLNISADLPFAQKRFLEAEDVHGVEALSSFRSSFARDYGLEINDGPLAGLCSRAVVVLDESDRVVYAEQVADIASEPDYEAALKALA